MKVVIESYCGLSCAECNYRESSNCGGCAATEGHPFHGECEIAECAKKKGIRFCGECTDIPCEILKRYSYDEEHGDNPRGARIERCGMLKSNLVQEARNGLDPVSYCGHHCDYCFLGEWCGGCRSDYNCCSFATLSEDKICPNVKCAKDKGLYGCYECDELSDCAKGYYSVANEYIAKSTALFIKKHGKACYTETLKRAIADGLNYPKTFDATGSVDNALKLLEKYM